MASKRSTKQRSNEFSQARETGVLYYVVFVDRGAARRIISLRKANRREVKHYVENF